MFPPEGVRGAVAPRSNGHSALSRLCRLHTIIKEAGLRKIFKGLKTDVSPEAISPG
ncbi:MAG TPA: hypothetical protein VN455_09165 [Methanotrichaceae archaeon]|nr:hypothetical protein [Methanotrichaceae archaeon]